MGELALINNAPRTATVICDTDVAVTCLNRGQFMELMGGLSVFGEAITTAFPMMLRLALCKRTLPAFCPRCPAFS